MLIPLPYKILAVVLVVGGAFAAGYKKGTSAGEVMIQQAANEAEQLKIELEKEQQNIKERVVTEYVDKIKVVKEREVIYQNAAENEVKGKYNLTNGWVYLHDASVKGEQLDPQKTTDDTDSVVKDNQALGTVLANYSVCLQNAQQLVSLQSWILETKASVDKQNAERGLDIDLPDMPKMPWKKEEATK
jgi:hypothetical protein